MEQPTRNVVRPDVVAMAREYYEKGKNQREIAAEVGVSCATVSRALKYARESGIVQISVGGHDLVCSSLATQLEELYPLETAMVVEGNAESQGLNNREIGLVGAQWLGRVIRDDMLVGFCWGSTVYELVKNVVPNKASGIKVVQLTGTMSMTNIRTQHFADELIRRVNNAFYASEYQGLPAPAVARNKQSLQVFLEEPVIHDAMESGRKCDIAILGVGLCDSSSNLVTAGYVSEEDLRKVAEQGGVGEIASRFYDVEGEPVVSDLDARTLTIALEDLKKIPLKIALAGGTHKAGAIRSAISGGYIDCLITDVGTAKVLLRMER